MFTAEIAELKNDIMATVTWALKEDLGIFDEQFQQDLENLF